MDNPKISVIVPVYNVEQYLPRCIDSILAQTFTDFEALLIDDGSTDKSGKICDEYAKKDNRIRVIRKSNDGVSATRELGVNIANGDYIQFIDSDDWMEKDMLELMINEVINKKADVVSCRFFEVTSQRITSSNTYYTSSDDFIRDVVRSNWGVVWKILVKRDLYIKNDIHFPVNINAGEDYVVCTKLLLCAQNIVCLNRALYYYNKCNEHSIMSTYNIQKVQDQIEATKLVETFLQEKKIDNKYIQELNERKFQAKLPLLKKYPVRWAKVFPECNYLYRQKCRGWKAKIFIWFILLIKQVITICK